MVLWLLRNLLVIGALTMHPPPRDYPVPLVCILVVVQWKCLTVADWRPCWLFGGFVLIYLALFIASYRFWSVSIWKRV